MKRWLLISVLFLIRLSLLAQPVNPGVDDIYRPGELATIRLTLTPADKTFLLNPINRNSEVYLKATFRMINSVMDTVLSKQVGIRLRGNTSRGQNKKPFKIDFREFNGKKFFGYKKFNLKPNVNDPSQVREPLTLQVYREMNIPAARTHPLRLYMNDEYMGTYLNVEQIDDVFLTAWYGYEDGFLYKCSYGATLENNGQIYNTSLFESEINEDDDTRAELNHFVQVLNGATDQDFSTEIEKVFQVDLYLRQLAVEALLGHWDGYSWNKNNFYLYYNPPKGKVEYFPYDVDNTWGIAWTNDDWGTRNLSQWAHNTDARPLTKRILNVPAYRTKYKQYLIQLLNTYFKTDYIVPVINAYKTLLSPAVQDDTYFDDAFGFTYNHFVSSFSTLHYNHVKYGITEYVATRTESAYLQLPGVGVITGVENEEVVNQIYPNPSQRPQAYYYSTTTLLNEPMVYSSTGVRIPIHISTMDDHRTEISLPEPAAHGIYIIHVGDKIFKWVYH